MITFATIVFKKELPLLFLQAKSIGLYASNIGLKKIIIVLNDAFENSEVLCIKSYYQLFAPKGCDVDVIEADKIFENDSRSSTRGWISQQALKLLVAKRVETDFYLILDAKNHLINELCIDDLFFDGKAIAYGAGHFNMWGACLGACERLLNMEPIKQRFILPATPYLMSSDAVAFLEKHLLESENIGLTEAIINNENVTEFLLYFCYLVKSKKLEHYYNLRHISESDWVTFFTTGPNKIEDIDRELGRLNIPETKWLGLHRNRFCKRYEKNIKDDICRVWTNANLFDDIKYAENFWDDMKELQA